MGYHYILSEHKDDVAYITINRPEKLNALNKLTIQELSDAIKKADRDTKVKCIILTGSGPKAFVAGADIKEFSKGNKSINGIELAKLFLKFNNFLYENPSIIVGRKGSAGEITLTEPKFWALDVTYYVTFDEERYSLDFLYYLLKKLDLPSLATGVKPGINRNNVYSISVKVPTLSSQKRISAVLKETETRYNQLI